jgi:hypothetical protein
MSASIGGHKVVESRCQISNSRFRIISDGLENKLKDFIRNNNKSSENLEKISLSKQKDVETRKVSGKNEGLKELDDIFQKLLLLK